MANQKKSANLHESSRMKQRLGGDRPRSADEPLFTRRRLLQVMAGGMCTLGLEGVARASEEPAARRTGLGVVAYALGLAQRARRARDLTDPQVFLEECHRLGAGGMQVPLGIRDEPYITPLRQFAEKHGLFIEAIVAMPQTRGEVDRFEKQLLTARQAGATVARTVVIPGRRYEYFSSEAQFAQAERQALEALQWVEPIAARHRLRLAVENHKCQRIPERLALFKQLSSEYIGACVDVGNSFSLCEDPMEVVRAYAPWAMTVHLKDQAVREYDQGFYFADVALGKGFLDLPAMVKVLRQARPAVRFSLEVITRDPLKVPVWTDKYWASMGQVPAGDLARTMRTVKRNAAPEPLELVSPLGGKEQVEAEARNVRQSLDYAQDHLQL